LDTPESEAGIILYVPFEFGSSSVVPVQLEMEEAFSQ
jgi:hypothetical protein